MSGRKIKILFTLSLLLLITIFSAYIMTDLPVRSARAYGLTEQSTPNPADSPGQQGTELYSYQLFMPLIVEKYEFLVLEQPIPYLQVAPMTHLDVIPEDRQITAYGRDFCIDPDCSPVSIKIGDRIILENVELDEFGSFQVPLTITELVGEYLVTAYQTLADGTVVEASLPVVVPIGDVRESEPPPPIPESFLIQSQANTITSVSEFQPNIFWGGRTVAIAVDPSNPAVALAAEERVGVFRTTDGGVTWSHIGTLQPFRLSDLRIDPNNSQNVIVTANSDSRTTNGAGIWRSSDGGSNWHKTA